MTELNMLADEISAWPNVATHPHRFGGQEFLFGSAEVGHIHPGGIVDIPFPRAVRNALLAAGLAEQHHWVPNSGWITFRVRHENKEDVGHALWLMRLCYLRYALKTASDPRQLLQQESEELNLNPEFKSLLERFVPNADNLRATQPLSAA
ncbi:MAG: luciferase family protein [Terriglobales bacterium]